MPRGDKILFKYTGDGEQRHHGIPMRDILESDRDSLSDEQMVMLAASPIYSARNDADEEVAKVEKRIEAPARARLSSAAVPDDKPKDGAAKDEAAT